MTELTSVRRDSDWIDREYGEQKWPLVEALIEKEIEAEREPVHLSRVHTTVVRRQYGADALGMRPAVFDGQTVQVPVGISVGGVSKMLQDIVLGRCSERTDLVLELGSGWGWHVLSAWLGGGPRDALYCGAEYTEAGRRCADRLASLEPDLNFRSLDFDYYEPDFSELGRFDEAVVFTGHSIEQIPYVKPELFEAIRGLAPSVTCIHLEPAGWQVDGQEREYSSRAYAEKHDYSRNLVEQLREEEAAGRIEIDAIVPNVVAVNANNATTVIIWRSTSP